MGRNIRNKYAALLWLMRNERRPRAQVRALQARALKALVRHAYEHVGLYRDLYDSAGVRPHELETVEDLRLLPTVSKHDYQGADTSDYLADCRPCPGPLRSITTSGSSGLPLEFFVDRHYDQLRKAQYLRPYLTNGRRLTDRVLRFCSESDPAQKWFHRFGLLRESVVFANSDIEHHLQLIRKERPQVIQGFGSELSLIAGEIASARSDTPKPRLVFTDSELLTPDIRRSIERGFGVDVIDVYGTYEVGNTAYECAEHNGYHLAEDCVITEWLDENDNPVEPGQSGELAFTVLYNHAMPLIRYRIGDVGRYSLDECGCGRTSMRMTEILGRTTDFAICGDGKRKSPTGFMGGFDALADRVREFQVVQREIDLFEVRVVPKHGWTQGLEDTMREVLLAEFPGVSVQVTPMADIARLPSGKYRAFVQECA